MDLNQIRDLINITIAKTENRIKEYEDMSQPVAPDDAIGRVSRMDAINNKSVTESALRKQQAKLQSLKYLITKVDSPEFGLCLKCKQPIQIERILYRPESRHCIQCAK
jgi:DnaK suppressor protein